MAIENMVGKTFNRLTITKQYYDINNTGEKRDFCDADCSCGNSIHHISGNSIRSGGAKSCGCYNREMAAERLRKTNQYYLRDNETMVGVDCNNKEFLFSPNKYEKVKNYCWWVGNDGYAQTKFKRKTIYLHHVVFDGELNGDRLDHKNRIRSDNRDGNLRCATEIQNHMNGSLQKNNTSGIIGVSWLKGYGRWQVSIRDSSSNTYIRWYTDYFEEAVLKRLLLEKELFGEFAPQKHLFEEFGIE